MSGTSIENGIKKDNDNDDEEAQTTTTVLTTSAALTAPVHSTDIEDGNDDTEHQDLDHRIIIVDGDRNDENSDLHPQQHGSELPLSSSLLSSSPSFPVSSLSPNSSSLSPSFYCPWTGELFEDPVVAPDGKSYERAAIVATKDYLNEQLYPNRALQSILKERLVSVGVLPASQQQQQAIAQSPDDNIDNDQDDDSTMRSKLQRLERSVRSSFSKLLENSIDGNSNDISAPTSSNSLDPPGRKSEDEGDNAPVQGLPPGHEEGPSQQQHDVLPEGYFCPITFELIHTPVIDPEGTTYEKNAIHAWIMANGTSPLTRTSLTVEELYDNQTVADLLEEEKSKPDKDIHPMIRTWKEQEPEPPSLEGILATMNHTSSSEGNNNNNGVGGIGILPNNNNNNGNSYDEMDQDRRGQNERSCFAFVMIISCYFLTIAVPYGLFIFIIFCLILCCFQKTVQHRQYRQQQQQPH